MSGIANSILFIYLVTTSIQLENRIKIYTVKKIDKPLEITGIGSDPSWKQSDLLTDFIYPWENDEPPLTRFRSLHDEQWIYFFFDVDDQNINVYVKANDKREAVRSDRVEIFFRQDESMSPYYCLEMDPLSRVFDCKGVYYRKLEPGWSWPEGQLEIKSHRHEHGYAVELRISKSSLKELGVLKDARIEAGLFRADCYELKGDKASFRWISWVHPHSETPDFHIPQAFGVLMLEN